MISTAQRSRSFSIELNSRDLIKRVSLPEGSGDRFIIEGLTGKLVEIELIEDIMLEIRATHGVLRIDLTRDEMEITLKGKKR